MNCWCLWQKIAADPDVYNYALVVAQTENDARYVHPERSPYPGVFHNWFSPDKEIGIDFLWKAIPGSEPGVIKSWFHTEVD